MNRREVYCTGEFLERLYHQLVESSKPDDLLDISNWIKVFNKFLLNECELIIDIDDEDIRERAEENPYYRRLYNEGRIKFHSHPDTFRQMEIDDQYFRGKTTELFLLSLGKEFCNNVKERYGLICTSLEKIDDTLPELCQFSIKIIHQEEALSWSFLEKFRFPSNAAVIADNYILKNRIGIDVNLFSILEALLPDQLNIEYHLTILCRETRNLENDYQLINEFLKSRYNYPIILSIGITETGLKNIHDRDIITNYCMYNSGAGFDLFKKTNQGLNSKYFTRIYILPAAFSGNSIDINQPNNDAEFSNQDNYISTLNHLKRVWENIPEKLANKRYFIGMRKNRLFN